MDFNSPTSEIQHKFRYGIIAVIVLFSIILLRLFQLQIIKGKYYRFFSTENSIKETLLPAPRGLVVDRLGNVLVENRSAFDIVVTPQYVVSSENMVSTVSEILNKPAAELKLVWKKRYKQPHYQPLVLKSDVNWNEMSNIRSKSTPWYSSDIKWDLRGVDVLVKYARFYPQGGIASHVLGYVREIDSARLKSYHKKYPDRYEPGDDVGIRGLEERWDLYLRGVDGYDQKIVDASGREVYYKGIAAELENKSPVPGFNLKLTIDKQLQDVAIKAFEGKTGAAVAVDVNSGAVRLLFSAPTYNLNELSSSDSNKYWGQLVTDKSRPLLNRAIQGAYPPGSIYKIITAIAGLSENVVTPGAKLYCGGHLPYFGRRYHCWNKHGHGNVALHRALVESCDVFFYRLGLSLGVDTIWNYASIFGLGKPTGISLEGERSGLIPTKEWKQKKYNVPWQSGENLSISVGQGFNLVTPLQSALMLAQVVNGGFKIRPYMVSSVYDSDGREIFNMKGEKLERLPVSQKILNVVKSALVGVVSENGGTAHGLSRHSVTMGGKTGTAQVVSLERECKKRECQDHAWFVGFAPADNPKLAVAVIVEHGGFGAVAAAPIVGKILQKYGETEGWVNEKK